MPPDLELSSTLISSNYPCLELIFIDPKVFEPLKFDCINEIYMNLKVNQVTRTVDAYRVMQSV